MSDTSSVYRICPQCGQSVSVAAKFCPTCGTPFAEENAEFVAYERYQAPEVTMAGAAAGAAAGMAAGDTQPFTPVTEGYTDPGFSYEAEAPVEEVAEDLPEFQRGRSSMAEEASNPGVRSTNFDPGRRNGLIVTVIAAVLLIAVIAVGVIMAFRLGIVGGEEEPDPMTLATEQVELQNYQEAINQLEQIVASGEATVETYQLLAQAYENVEEPEKAADAYLRGFQTLKDSTLKKAAIDAYLKLGDEARAEEDNVTAKAHYETVLEKLDPSNSTAIANLASLKQEAISTPPPTVSPSPSAAAIAPPSPTASAAPSPSALPGAPTSPKPTGGLVTEDEAVVTPTPKPSPTPTPTPKPSPTPTPTPKPTPTPTPTPSPSPTPTPTPTFELNGHKYQIIVGDFTWWQAHEDAQTRGGHVLTVSSADEFNKAATLANSYGLVFMWLDAFVNSPDQWETISYQTGEPIDYVAWYPGEPSGGDEAYLSMFKVNGSWYYNDAVNQVNEYSGKKGYILEIDG